MLFTAALVVFTALWWLLHGPYRGVGSDHYDTPRRFLLTGCASGMGRHLAGALLRRGHAVFATDFNETGLHTAALEDGWEGNSAPGSLETPPRLVLRRLDVTSRAQWEAVMDEIDEAWGGLDACFNIAVRISIVVT